MKLSGADNKINCAIKKKTSSIMLKTKVTGIQGKFTNIQILKIAAANEWCKNYHVPVSKPDAKWAILPITVRSPVKTTMPLAEPLKPLHVHFNLSNLRAKIMALCWC